MNALKHSRMCGENLKHEVSKIFWIFFGLNTEKESLYHGMYLLHLSNSVISI